MSAFLLILPSQGWAVTRESLWPDSVSDFLQEEKFADWHCQHVFIQYIFIHHMLLIRHCFNNWGYRGEKQGRSIKGQIFEWVVVVGWQWTSLHVCVLRQSLSHTRLFGTPWTIATGLLHPWDSPGKNIGRGCHFLLQGSFRLRDWTHVSCTSCTGRCFLYHCDSRDTPKKKHTCKKLIG